MISNALHGTIKNRLIRGRSHEKGTYKDFYYFRDIKCDLSYFLEGRMANINTRSSRIIRYNLCSNSG